MYIKRGKNKKIFTYLYMHKILWKSRDESNNYGYLFVVG